MVAKMNNKTVYLGLNVYLRKLNALGTLPVHSLFEDKKTILRREKNDQTKSCSLVQKIA